MFLVDLWFLVGLWCGVQQACFTVKWFVHMYSVCVVSSRLAVVAVSLHMDVHYIITDFLIHTV